MGEQRTKTRVSRKIDELPQGIRERVDVMLADTRNTYWDVSGYLKDQGYEISKSAVGRYAMRSNKAAQRLMEAQAKTAALVNVVKKNPEADYTEAGMMLMMDGLINRIATADEEWDVLPLDKVGRLIASLSRTKIYKDRVKQDMKDKADLAFAEMEGEIMKTIKSNPALAAKLKDILTKAKEMMLND